MSLQNLVGHVTVKTEHSGVAGKQDVIQVSLRDLDPMLDPQDVEAIVHRGVVRAIIQFNKEADRP